MASNERVTLCAGKYEIFSGNPLSDLNTPGALAYMAQGARGSTNLLALVAKPGELPRFSVLGDALKINSASVLRFIEADITYWPDFGQQTPVLLYERPTGAALIPSLTEDRAPLNNELFFRQMVESLAEGIRDIYLSGCNHGRINPTNIFLRDASSGSIQLGDYLSAIPGKYQHPAFCTIERLMAAPAARGIASASDDIYAVGVTLLSVLLGKLPAINLPIEELITAKVEKGSLMALSGGARIPSAYSEIFRGLLSDDPAQRWALDDITHWLGGRRTGSKPAAQIPKAQRGYEIAGQTYNNVRLLAQAMARNVDQAGRGIEDGSLDRWVRRSLGDETKAEKIVEAISSAGAAQRGGSPAERTVTRVAITLDPPAPIRFRDISTLPAGLGGYLADTLIKGQSPRNVADLIAAQFIIHWANSQSNYGAEHASLLQQYEGIRMLLDRPQHGFGVERVVYELYPDCPCLSPLTAKHFPLSLKALCIAIEAYAETVKDNDTRSEPMDRHIAAYILSHHKRMNDRLFPLLAANSQPGQRAVAILSILAEVQRKFHPEPMPRTAEWLARLLQPSMERYHNRNLREKVIRDVTKLSKRGELDQMLSIIDDGNMQKADEDGFNAAQMEWQQLEHFSREISTANESRNKALLLQGRQITAFIGGMAAAAAIVTTVFMRLF